MEEYSALHKTVAAEDLAMVMKSGDLPVLATPRMIAWMEEASCLLIPLKEKESSVGISVEIRHTAPAPLGAEIRIESRLIEQNGRIFTCRVSAWWKDICLGEGIHKRAVVDRARFLERLEKEQ